MSKLTLVRHGQARAFEEDSDRLSEAGERQARLLGQCWAEQRLLWQEVHTGSLVRQVRTAESIAASYRAAGLPFPQPVVDARWNEYDSTGVLSKVQPVLAASDPSFSALAEAAERYRTTPDANRHFQRMFEILMTRWIAGDVNAHGVESWDTFQSRVCEALHRIITAQAESRNVLVVTSGGPIAVSVQTVLASPPSTILDLNWRMRNSSVTEFLFSRGRITLDLFNAVPHLQPSEVTYR